MLQYLCAIIILCLSFCTSRQNVRNNVLIENRRRNLANTSNDSSQQNGISGNKSANIVPSSDSSSISTINKVKVPTSQPSSIVKAPSQDMISEGPTLAVIEDHITNETAAAVIDADQVESYSKSIAGAQNINEQIREEDALALETTRCIFYAILISILLYGLVQIIQGRSSGVVIKSVSTPNKTNTNAATQRYAALAAAAAENLELEDDVAEDSAFFSEENLELARRSQS